MTAGEIESGAQPPADAAADTGIDPAGATSAGGQPGHAVRRYALGLEYDGGGFSGWQRLNKPGGVERRSEPTVQAAVEAALSFVAGHRLQAVCAGRTDAGVHAMTQVVHFDTAAQREPRGWVLGVGSRLPRSVCALWCVPVADDFHARYSARARRYSYRLLNRPLRPALQRQYLSWERLPLDADAMHRAAQALVGEHDFSAFRTASCQARHPRRDLQHIAVRREDDVVEIVVQANAFLHHMVRNIVGSLLMIGRGERPESWLGELLAGRDRTVAGPTAPAAGLVFVGPRYPVDCRLPAEVCL